MSYKDKIETTKVISDGPLTGLYGTAMLGNTWGEITGADLAQSAEVTEIKVGKKIVAIEIAGGKHTLNLTIKLTKDTEPPGIGDIIQFPLEAMQGRVTGEAKLAFSDADFATYTCAATSWHDIKTNGGAGTLTTDITAGANGMTKVIEGKEAAGA